MVFVVRRDLGWHKQKLAVMTAHAALALFKKVYKARNPALMQWVRSTAQATALLQKQLAGCDMLSLS
jgi:peptidyl-tRNA hydrolase